MTLLQPSQSSMPGLDPWGPPVLCGEEKCPHLHPSPSPALLKYSTMIEWKLVPRLYQDNTQLK